ncbi:hypothetical protein FACS189428_5670 [Clostridia bacterium]|nr:hypothetical protein FACS189428_5670 [Clostridia bacterium]
MDGIVELTGSLMVSGFSKADFFSLAVLAGFGTVRTVIGVALGVLQIVALWFILEKAKLPGWGAIIPVYNIYLLFKLVGHPYWTRWILFPPVLGILAIIAQFNLAERF